MQLPASQVTLTGNGAPGNGGTITFAWTKITSPVSAPNPIIAIPNAASTLVTGLTEGVYVFRLTVTQNDNQVATSDVTITVVPVPTLPIITTNDPQTIVTTNVALSSTSSGNVPLVSTKWTKFSVQGQGLKKLTVIGSSTAAGNGTTSGDSTLVNRLKAYYQAQGILSTVTNLAQSGSTPFDLNITTTLNTTQPDVLLVCYPSNLYTASTNITVLARFQEIYDSATNRGIACYISGTQPRNDFNAADRANLIVLNEALRTKFEAKFIDFLTATLNTTDNSIKTEFSAGDGIHLNNTGHERLYQLVRGG
ncbi:MAG: GDSL-type esterase/lipase family protein [Chitinophagaceae bacterium]